MTPSLAEVLKMAIEERLASVHTAMPARVVKYDPATQRVDVEPCLKRENALTGEQVALPVIPNVPLMFPRTKKAWVALPVAVGDYVELIIQERPIDRVMERGGVVDLEDPRRFDLTDCVAIPGLFPDGEAMNLEAPTALELKNDSAELRLHPDGKVSVKASSLLLGDHSGLTKSVAIAENVNTRLAAIETWLAAHVHTSSAPTVATSPPVTPLVPVTSPGSSKVKVSE